MRLFERVNFASILFLYVVPFAFFYRAHQGGDTFTAVFWGGACGLAAFLLPVSIRDYVDGYFSVANEDREINIVWIFVVTVCGNVIGAIIVFCPWPVWLVAYIFEPDRFRYLEIGDAYRRTFKFLVAA